MLFACILLFVALSATEARDTARDVLNQLNALDAELEELKGLMGGDTGFFSHEDPKVACLGSVNKYRMKHLGTPLLQWDQELTRKAQGYANILMNKTLKRGKLFLQHDPANQIPPGMGENLWYANGWPAGDLGFYCKKADISWYSEINNWDFKTSSRKTGVTGQTGHFTQQVWRGTTKVGYGLAIANSPTHLGKKIVFVVAKYTKPGNIHVPGDRHKWYSSNVRPLKSTIAPTTPPATKKPITPTTTTMKTTKLSTEQPTKPTTVKTTRQSTKPTIVKSTVQPTKPIKPTTKIPTVRPSTMRPVKSTVEPAEPTTTPAEPTAEPTLEPTEPTDPTDPTEPIDETTVGPTTKPTEPTTTTPAEPTAEPTLEPTEPTEPTESLEETTVGPTTKPTEPTTTTPAEPTAEPTLEPTEPTEPTETLEETTVGPTTIRPTEPPTTQPPTEPPIPPVEYGCDFERDMCNLTIVEPNAPRYHHTKPTSWSRVPYTKYGIQDRAAEKGFFLVSKPYRTQPLRTPDFVGGPQALQFFYVGFKGTLKVELLVGDKREVIAVVHSTPASSAHPPTWKEMRKNYNPPEETPYHFQFTALNGYFALDDISLLPVPSTTIDIPLPNILACGFHSRSNPICSWKQTGNFNWTTAARNTPSLHTGPKRAVTAISGDKYLYAEASYPRKEGDRAILRSPHVESNEPSCMVLFSNTHGLPEQTGHLRVKVETHHTNGNTTTEVKELTADDREQVMGGDNWNIHYIDLPTEMFHLELIAAVGEGPNGDVAIDNIAVLPGPCDPKNEESIECDFEEEELCAKDLKIKSKGFKASDGSKPAPVEGQRIHICEHGRPDSEWLFCPQKGHVIKIIKAMYGRLSSDVCPRGNTKVTNCMAGDSLKRTRDMCDDRKKCRVSASNGVYGDPCRGVTKYLDITFKCVKGKEKRVTYQKKRVGCFRDRRRRAIPGRTIRLHPSYIVNQCFLMARRTGNDIFAVQNQNECRMQSSSRSSYAKYGRSYRCRRGRGGPWANEVYKVVQVVVGEGGSGNKGGVCPSKKQKGFCVESNGRDQNRGVRKLERMWNGNSANVQRRCLKKCLATKGATGCEVIWRQWNSGCYVHTRGVARGNGARNHVCWVFDRCHDNSTPYTHLGCWRDSYRRAMSVLLEGKDWRLRGSYRSRRDAINKCYMVAKQRGYGLFSLQHGGQCFASRGGTMYRRYGKTTRCRNGKGAGWANDVYRINQGFNPHRTTTTTPTPATTAQPLVVTTPHTNATLPEEANTFMRAMVSPSRRTCVGFVGHRCVRWRTVGGGTKRSTLTFTLPDVHRFGGCVTFEYRVYTSRPSTVVSFTVNGRLLIGRRSYYVRGKTVRAVDEGPYWETARMTIPPRPTSGPFTVDIRATLNNGRLKQLDIDNISLNDGLMCGAMEDEDDQKDE